VNLKVVAVVLAIVLWLAAFTAAGWAGFRATTTRIAPDTPTPYPGHPSSGCAWCHVVEG